MNPSQTAREAPAHNADTINTVLGITPGSAMAQLRGKRPELVERMQGSCDAVLVPVEPGGLAHDLRAALASRIAWQNNETALAKHYRSMLEKHPRSEVLAMIADGGNPDNAPERIQTILRHTDLLATTPKDATRQDIEKLGKAGIDDADIVRLSELVALVSFQVRVIAGLRLLGDVQ
jgi:CMD domain protein